MLRVHAKFFVHGGFQLELVSISRVIIQVLSLVEFFLSSLSVSRMSGASRNRDSSCSASKLFSIRIIGSLVSMICISMVYKFFDEFDKFFDEFFDEFFDHCKL